MLPRAHLATALTLAALGLAPGAAHLMELPAKLRYEPAFYAQVTSTLYATFGLVGGGAQVAALLLVAALAWRARRSSSAALLAASAACLAASLALWGSLVAPVNAAWAEAGPAGSPAFVAAYERLSSRWEYGHVAAFIAWLTGWLGLVAAATRAPARGTPDRGAAP